MNEFRQKMSTFAANIWIDNMKKIILLILFMFSIAASAMRYDAFTNIRIPYDANVINCIFQDSQGMIWLGSKRGLLGYNGYDFHQFSYNAVQAIVQVGNNLCIGSDNGIWWLNLNTGLQENFYKKLDNIGAVRSLAIWDGNLWIGTRDDGLFAFDFKTEELHKLFANNKETIVFALEETYIGLFSGTHEGLYLYNKEHIRTSILEDTIVYALFFDGNNLWVGTEGAFYKYIIGSGTFEKVLTIEGNAVKAIIKDNSGCLLLGTNEGVLVYDKANGKTEQTIHSTRAQNSLCNNIVNDALCDKNNNVWFATNNGISIAQLLPLYKTTHLSELTSKVDGNVFECSLIDSHKNYWFGGENGLLQISGKNVKWWNVGSGLRHGHIRSIYEDRDGYIWIASDGSIACYNHQQDAFTYYNIEGDNGKNANWAYCIYEDESNRLWVGTYMGGLYIIDKKELLSSNGNLHVGQNHFTGNIDAVNTVFQLYPDEKGNLWLNTGKGLAYLNTKKLRIELKGIYLDNMIYADGAVWLSSLGQLVRYDGKTNEVKELLFSSGNSIIHAFVKENNHVWFSCSEGLYYIDTSNNQINSLYTSEEFYSGTYNQEHNEIIFGGEDRITSYYLDRIDQFFLPDSIYITGISVNGTFMSGKSILSTSPIRLSSGKNVTLELSTLTFISHGQESYYYKLGEDQWHKLDKGINKLVFADMAYGDNQLFLSTTNPDIDDQSHIMTYLIYVSYPWYLSWWAFSIYIFFILCIVIGIIRYIQIRNKRKYEEREREKSLELSRQKMDFFVNVSHELKTPLTLIIAPLSRMISETTNLKQRERLKAIHKNSLRLNNLIYKILDFKRMEYESEDTLIRSHVELCSLIRSCIQTFETTITQRHLTVKFQPNVESVWINADMLKLESVFINIISNSVKYIASDTGKIDINLSLESNNAIITFTDNGKGIPEEDIPMMFVRFFQGKNALRGGTGIGLYLVKKFIDLHGGEIDVHNTRGLSVKISLPIKGENAITYFKQETEPPIEEKEAKLLIIDDNKEIVDFLAESLSNNYICLKAYNGLEGKGVVAKSLPDLIIVDQMMPGIDGFEFCRWIRHNHHTVNVPLIMLTAKDDTATELESIKIGVDVFISKPFDIKKVQLHIAQLLQRRRSIEKAVNIEHIINPVFISDEQRSADEILMENITKTIEDHMEQESFNVSQLAQILNIDQKQLYRKSKQLTGMTPIAYLKKLRMKKAAMLLKENRFTVSEVMYLVGYTNASYFSKCFSEEFGMNPKQYADNNSKV